MAEKEYIERKAIINKIVNTPTVPSRQCYEGNFVYADGVSGRQNEIINYINEQPTADVAPVRHGHWETISDSDMSKTVMCSVCNKMFYFTKKGQLNIDMMPYCPNCGARMDKESEENNNG